MRNSIPPAVRQLEKLLQEKFIPWSQNGAPLVLFGSPPRSALPLAIREEKREPLPAMLPIAGYQKSKHWKAEKVNAVDVPIIGCVFEGKVDYRVHSAPGQPGREWTVPIQQGTMFFIPAGTPFSDGSDPPADAPYARALLIYLRRDGINCHGYTTEKGKLWLHPYTFLHEPDALLPCDRLMRELQNLDGPPDAIVYHYLSLILCLMLRCLRQGNFSTLKFPKYPDYNNQSPHPSNNYGAKQMIEFVAEYIDLNLTDPNLSIKDVAQQASLSQGHLNRLFRHEKGMTVRAYLNEKRFQRATQMLATSPLSIARIAGLCGFNDQTYFSHWFSRRAGYSPSDHRRQMTGDVEK